MILTEEKDELINENGRLLTDIKEKRMYYEIQAIMYQYESEAKS
ncbi:MAG: hypothetical protein PHH04_07160 [Thomasclavelia sp.]|nr:hypothetical protein [Thomasclavelia sp.]